MSTNSNGGTVRSVGSATGSDASFASLRAGRQRQQITWGDADHGRVLRIVEQLTEAGGMVSLSKTSDQGCLVLFVRLGDGQEKLYAATTEALQMMLDDLAVWAAEL